jgi:hypothetical protein
VAGTDLAQGVGDGLDIPELRTCRPRSPRDRREGRRERRGKPRPCTLRRSSRRVGLAPGGTAGPAPSVGQSVATGVAGGFDTRDRLHSRLERPTTPVAARASGSPVSWFPLYRRDKPAHRAGTRTGGDKSVEENPCGVTCKRASADVRPAVVGALGVGQSVVGGVSSGEAVGGASGRWL